MVRIQEVNQHLNCLMASDMSFPLSMNLVRPTMMILMLMILKTKTGGWWRSPHRGNWRTATGA